MLDKLTSRKKETDGPGVLEALDHFPEVDVETGVTYLLSSRGPLDINAEGVAY